MPDAEFAISARLSDHERRILNDRIKSIHRYYAGLIIRFTACVVPTIIMHDNGQLENTWPPAVQEAIGTLNHQRDHAIRGILAPYNATQTRPRRPRHGRPMFTVKSANDDEEFYAAIKRTKTLQATTIQILYDSMTYIPTISR